MTETTLPYHKKHLFVILFHMMKGLQIFFQLSVYSKVKQGLFCVLIVLHFDKEDLNEWVYL